MADIKHSLSKVEMERLSNLLSVAKIQEELLNAISLSYKVFVVGSIFKRLGLKEELFSRCVVDLQNGELVIREEQKPPTISKTVEVKK